MYCLSQISSMNFLKLKRERVHRTFLRIEYFIARKCLGSSYDKNSTRRTDLSGNNLRRITCWISVRKMP